MSGFSSALESIGTEGIEVNDINGLGGGWKGWKGGWKAAKPKTGRFEEFCRFLDVGDHLKAQRIRGLGNCLKSDSYLGMQEGWKGDGRGMDAAGRWFGFPSGLPFQEPPL